VEVLWGDVVGLGIIGDVHEGVHGHAARGDDAVELFDVRGTFVNRKRGVVLPEETTLEQRFVSGFGGFGHVAAGPGRFGDGGMVLAGIGNENVVIVAGVHSPGELQLMKVVHAVDVL